MTAKILDIGVDLGFLNNRLNIQFDYFRRVRDGIPEPRYDVLIPVSYTHLKVTIRI